MSTVETTGGPGSPSPEGGAVVAQSPQPASAPALAAPLLQQRQVQVGLAVVGGLVGLLYWPTFEVLYQQWTNNPNYSHGFLVPLLSAWLAWRWCQKQPLPGEGLPALGGMQILAGSMVHLAAYVIGSPLLDFFGLVLVLRGTVVAIGGREWAKGFTFPIGLLFFMFPLPVAWTTGAANWLQEQVSLISGMVLNLFTVCYQRGTMLYIAGLNDPLVVAEECSGLRQIVAFVALATLVGYFSARSALFRILLILAALPVAIAANVLRVLLMAGGICFFGSDWTKGPLHDAPALITMPIGLVLFLLIAWGMGKVFPQKQLSSEEVKP